MISYCMLMCTAQPYRGCLQMCLMVNILRCNSVVLSVRTWLISFQVHSAYLLADYVLAVVEFGEDV